MKEKKKQKDPCFKNYNYISGEPATHIFVYPRGAFAFAITPCLVTQQTAN
jgi:hypothetical protein